MIVGIINLAINALIFLVIVRAVLSWFPDFSRNYPEISRTLNNITDPILTPFQRLIPPQRTGGIDLSPVLAVIALGIIRGILCITRIAYIDPRWPQCR